MAGENEEVKLLGMWASPFSWRVEIALKLKGVPYKYIEEDLSNKSPLLLELNPVYKKIPVLVHKGKPIAESLIILEYIDETWTNNPILPFDPYNRAMARFWAKFIDEKVLMTALKSVKGAENERDETIKELQEQMMFLEKELKENDFFGGESIGYVDIVGILIAFWMTRGQEANGIELISEQKFPNIYRWIKMISEIDMVKQFIPPKEKHIEYMKLHIQRHKSAQEQTKN